MRSRLALILLLPLAATAAEIRVCFNYGCTSEQAVDFGEPLLAGIGASLAEAGDAATERQRLAAALGRLYREAGRQSPISADRAGNVRDEGVFGKMDCIDHSMSTTRLLSLLEGRGMLRHHRVLPRTRRTRLLLFQHFAATLEELPVAGAAGKPRRFAIDSWFVEQGEPPLVLPLEAWLDGEGPDVH
ncbi:MAG: hypothetical protein KDG52_15235 [Rhodocyclaceae bacterium]|nr:hypothetical protein [Rhodocyclaceae bacterium]